MITTFQKLCSKALILPMAANENSAEAFVIMAMAEVDKHETQLNALLFALQCVRRWK